MPIIHATPENDPPAKYPLMEVDGCRYPYFCDEEVIRNMPEMDIRDDDVMLCGYMRSGTHWCFEVMNMLLRKCDDTIPYKKEDFHLELTSSEELACRPSPRVLNGHMHFERVPKAALEKKLKIVYVLRDPRDVACSWYQLMKKYFLSVSKVEICPFADWMKLFLNGEFEWGTWFDHVTNWEKAMANPNHSSSILVVRFEDLVTQPLREIERIDEFLNTKTDETFRRLVAEKCSLENMKRDKHSVTDKLEGKSVHYNQGKIGSWKDCFSAELSEYFKRVYDEKMKDSKFYNMYRQQV
ncbi:3-alpha-hydroxysteroid sulfotransferase-like isoform X6 [Haliotis rubra]|uniref:3-alpha-hydroxysteroid sulfotransferase-like isoform X6 n=1 Tax=Haliotis rubra TaxID=36100 RepID=UPI001EE614A2|nr:3-alpha-hydroxysteroid sulfotransferase-like isoform X6 [Haliotis rubra]XP_046559667.1 3-alpha-hydroxysteroid sulfotransferase-like isoform X6 [Haliotis rubra]XP_046559668.1 3-alpha-hydroxysteroid sulfotransferase-like isoform X6 [Haliotis rubra]XP_046559669.1 3-alpha-hydroxysteroid sulfotransferase-like isoform X6 [Haliotis rubra]